MCDVKRSRRGVYYDLSASPYEFRTSYGDCFKFSSAKKLEIYTRDVEKELKRVDALIERHDLGEFIPREIVDLIKRAVCQSFYKSIER